jgi:nucleotide-binding universal stress UspA family protein
MVPKIKKILYATDMSEHARYAFSYAADLAQRYEASITVLYVMEHFNPALIAQVEAVIGTGRVGRFNQEKQDALIQNAKQDIQDFCEAAESQFPACTSLVDDIQIVKGYAHEEILAQSKKMQADIIVLGSHGYGLVQEAVLGDTVRKVVRKSKLPVLVVKIP